MPILKIIEYTEKCIVVTGDEEADATKKYKEQLVEAKGKFNGRLKVPGNPDERFAGYIFPIGKYDAVTELVDQINEGIIKPVEQDDTYQTVYIKVKKPKADKAMLLYYNGGVVRYCILNMTGGRTVVTFTARPEGEMTPTKDITVIISNGQWQIYGFLTEHTIDFEV